MSANDRLFGPAWTAQAKSEEEEARMQPSTLNVVVAFIRPSQVDRVLDAVRRVPNFPGLSLSEVHGFSASVAGPPREDRAAAHSFETNLRLEIYCRPAEVVALVETIRKAAHTGQAGDGKIFAAPVTLAYRIRSGEWGESAIRPAHRPSD